MLIALVVSLVGVGVVWVLFLDAVWEYLKASWAFGFGKIGLVYRPLTDYIQLMKESELRDGHSHGYYRRVVRQNPDCKMVYVKMLGLTILCVVDPEIFKTISSSANIHNFDRKAMIPFISIFSKGLMFLSGKEWKKSRLILCDLFHFDKLQERESIIEDIVASKIQNLDGTSPDLFVLGQKISSEIVLNTLMGEDFAQVKF